MYHCSSDKLRLSSMYLAKTPVIVKKLFPKSLWSVPTKNKEIYLTFDDGPIPEITPWVLDELKKYDAQATFFCIGSNIEQHPEIFRRVINAGHTIGNHTFNHLNGWKVKNQKYLDDIAHCEQAILKNYRSTINNHPPTIKFFRPPYGKLRPSQHALLCAHYSVIMWDVLSGDFDKSISGEKCLVNILRNTKKGSIIVFHDSIKAFPRLEYALPRVLEYFAEKGFGFKSL